MQKTYSQADFPTGLYVNIYGARQITSVSDLNIWVQRLTNPSQELAIKIRGKAMDEWYVTNPAFLDHAAIPMMLNGIGLEKSNAQRLVWNEAEEFIGRMNVRMAMDYAVLPAFAAGLTLINPDESCTCFRMGSGATLVHPDNRGTVVSITEFKALTEEERVNLLLSKFLSTFAYREAWLRYPAIYQTIEVAQRLVGSKVLALGLGDEEKNCAHLREVANDYRHGVSSSADKKRGNRSYDDTALLQTIVRTSLELARRAREENKE